MELIPCCKIGERKHLKKDTHEALPNLTEKEVDSNKDQERLYAKG